jgi:nicotinamidase/pyrazinamidase
LGLATDYCVKFRALDARRLGLATKVILEGACGVELKSGDCQRAIAQMEQTGVGMVHEQEI